MSPAWFSCFRSFTLAMSCRILFLKEGRLDDFPSTVLYWCQQLALLSLFTQGMLSQSPKRLVPDSRQGLASSLSSSLIAGSILKLCQASWFLPEESFVCTGFRSLNPFIVSHSLALITVALCLLFRLLVVYARECFLSFLPSVTPSTVWPEMQTKSISQHTGKKATSCTTRDRRTGNIMYYATTCTSTNGMKVMGWVLFALCTRSTARARCSFCSCWKMASSAQKDKSSARKKRKAERNDD